jgi:hypothetical protein
MSGFSDPITGSDGQLLIAAIESPDYVPGVSGWRIGKDGTVDVNSGTFRGDVTVGTATQSVDITETVPPELIAFYAQRSIDVIESVIKLAAVTVNGPTYSYMVMGVDSAGSSGMFAAGFVDVNGTVKELYVSDFNINSAAPPETLFGLTTPGTVAFGNDNPGSYLMKWRGLNIQLSSITNRDFATLGGDLQNDGISAPRGFTDHGIITANVAGIGQTSVQILQSDAPRTWRPGRAYRITVNYFAACTPANSPIEMTIEQLGAAHSVMTSQVEIIPTSGHIRHSLSHVFLGPPVVRQDSIGVLLRAVTAGSTADIFASAFSPTYFDVQDIGAASDYPSQPSLN